MTTPLSHLQLPAFLIPQQSLLPETIALLQSKFARYFNVSTNLIVQARANITTVSPLDPPYHHCVTTVSPL
jgi:hypothetical protein